MTLSMVEFRVETLEKAYLFLEARPMLFTVSAVLLLFLAAFASHIFIKLVLRRLARIWAPHLGDIAGEYARDGKLFHRLALFVPMLVIFQGVALLPGVSPVAIKIVQKLAIIASVAVGLGVVTRVLSLANEIYSRYPISRTRPIKGLIQVVTIVMYLLALIIVLSAAFDKSPLVIISGLGAMTAILLLVFRDTILSLVAGVQLTTNGLLSVGDWIEMPQFGADGDVIDIALHSVKVRNWDKTITVIPAHKFLENSFKNWRGMTETGGRRIKRSFFIDMNTVRFLNEEDIERFANFALLKEYVAEKKREIKAHNEERGGDDALVHNSRRLTNLGTFRAYLTAYLRQNPQIHSDLTFLVRQLQPTAEGLPIEVYVFSRDIRWAYYEGIQADIFDHVFAVIPHFGLSVYQRPGGRDLQGLVTSGE